MALLEPGLATILIAHGVRSAQDAVPILERLEAYRTWIVVISDQHALLSRADLPLGVVPWIPEWLSPMISVIPAQLFALCLAQALGYDADSPRGLSKITRTH